jgi:hypothetical protein
MEDNPILQIKRLLNENWEYVPGRSDIPDPILPNAYAEISECALDHHIQSCRPASAEVPDAMNADKLKYTVHWFSSAAGGSCALYRPEKAQSRSSASIWNRADSENPHATTMCLVHSEASVDIEHFICFLKAAGIITSRIIATRAEENQEYMRSLAEWASRKNVAVAVTMQQSRNKSRPPGVWRIQIPVSNELVVIDYGGRLLLPVTKQTK